MRLPPERVKTGWRGPAGGGAGAFTAAITCRDAASTPLSFIPVFVQVDCVSSALRLRSADVSRPRKALLSMLIICSSEWLAQ
jgi:hypothetical protein